MLDVSIKYFLKKLYEGSSEPVTLLKLSPSVLGLIQPGWQSHQSSVMKLGA